MRRKMWQLKPNDTRHHGKSFWFAEDGTILYGHNLDNLVYPEGLELAGVLPPVSLADLKEAFLLGTKAGKEAPDLLKACQVALDALGCDRVSQDRLEAQKIIHAIIKAREGD